MRAVYQWQLWARIRAQAGGWAGGGLCRPRAGLCARHAGQCWPRSLGGQQWPSERQETERESGTRSSVETRLHSDHNKRTGVRNLLWRGQWLVKRGRDREQCGVLEMLWHYDTTGWGLIGALACYNHSLMLRLWYTLGLSKMYITKLTS